MDAPREIVIFDFCKPFTHRIPCFPDLRKHTDDLRKHWDERLQLSFGLFCALDASLEIGDQAVETFSKPVGVRKKRTDSPG